MPVQLEHRQESGDDDAGLRDPRDRARGSSGVPASRSSVTTIAACSRMLTSGACRWSRPTCGISFGVIASSGQRREVVGAERPDELGNGVAVLLVEAHRAGVTAVLALQAAGEPRRDLLERAVLQQPREQQVARLEQRHRLGVDELALRQQPGDLHVEQRRGDDEELGRLVELLVGSELRADTR